MIEIKLYPNNELIYIIKNNVYIKCNEKNLSIDVQLNVWNINKYDQSLLY